MTDASFFSPDTIEIDLMILHADIFQLLGPNFHFHLIDSTAVAMHTCRENIASILNHDQHTIVLSLYQDTMKNA